MGSIENLNKDMLLMIQRFFSFEKWFSSPEQKGSREFDFSRTLQNLNEEKKVNSRLVLLTFRKSSKPFST